jgi:hypothetical protein
VNGGVGFVRFLTLIFVILEFLRILIYVYINNSMRSSEQKLTSVKVNPDQFEEFKILSIKYKGSLNKLVDVCMNLYINDEEFRKMINNSTVSR